MSVAAYAHPARSVDAVAAPRLQLVATPRQRPARRRDAAYALCLAALLSVGVLGVLLLNTSMQQQADRMAAQRQRLAQLTLRVETLRATLDQAANPTVLAARARALHMRPARRFEFLAAASAPRRVNARRPAAPTARAG